MIDTKINKAIEAAFKYIKPVNPNNIEPIKGEILTVFGSELKFLQKVNAMDEVFNSNPKLEHLREIFFDLLLVNFFSADVKKLDEDYLDSPEWEKIEEQTLDRGTEMLNVLLYLNECEDEGIEPELSDYLTEFLLVDEDEFQDEHRIYEPVIANQILMESGIEEIGNVAKNIPEDEEIKELFYPLMCFFYDTEPSEEIKKAAADNAVEPDFDLPVLEIMLNFNA
ncbi:MAG: hypothetical protein EOP42_24660 [Sphingobacteriaceae bacterium]|nr:MAG: hypothetical protein EOP42_24660 [Sphingobacteriaceae bacterium]